MNKETWVFGSSLNPPTRAHLAMVLHAAAFEFVETLVIPSGGKRPDKITNDFIAPHHRAQMADMAFGQKTGATVDLSDLERDRFTPHWALHERLVAEAKKPVFMIGADVLPQLRSWERGDWIAGHLDFAVFTRPGFEFDRNLLPRNSRVIELDCPHSSREVRELIFRGAGIDEVNRFVPSRVADYIFRHMLYTQAIPPVTYLQVEKPRLMIFADDRNSQALLVAEKFRKFEDAGDPNLILVAGGDGTMVNAVMSLWKYRLPFFGINCGRLGFLLNDLDPNVSADKIFARSLEVLQTPLLHVTVANISGSRELLAVNDAWVERASGQTGHFQLKINGRVPANPYERMEGDLLLVCTAAGSTAYFKNLGMNPFQVGTPMLGIAGSAVARPYRWHGAYHPLDTIFEIACLDGEKRPVRGFVDGVPLGEVNKLAVRSSRVAAAEFAYLPGYNLQQKMIGLQYPS